MYKITCGNIDASWIIANEPFSTASFDYNYYYSIPGSMDDSELCRVDNNWMWFDVFRKYTDKNVIFNKLSSKIKIRRVQEKLSRLIKAKHKRKMYIQS